MYQPFEIRDKQHIAFVIGMGGLVPCPDIVEACLQPSPGTTRRILDLGCGTGIWAIEMAKLYPHASVVGVDLAPAPVDKSTLPSNCRFEVDDVNLGLQHFHGQYDVVHARLISSGLKSYRKMMDDAEKCLKPGGVVIFIDYDAQFCAEDQVSRQPMAESNENGSWLVRCSHEMRNGAPLMGSDILGMEASLDEGIWGHELVDPETVQAASMFLPIGPWPRVPDPAKQQLLTFSGTLIRQDYTSAFYAVLPVYAKLGVPQEAVDEWKPKVEAELASSALHMWSRTRMAWGRRRAGPNEPAPPLPAIQIPEGENLEYTEQVTAPGQGGPAPVVITSSGETAESPDYQFLHVYKTPEELAAAVKFRNESLGKVPVPWVLRPRPEKK